MIKTILNPLTEAFPGHHKYSKLFNKNNVKISNSRMPNMKSTIQNHNVNLLSKHSTPVAASSYSCR